MAFFHYKCFIFVIYNAFGLPQWPSGKESAYSAGDSGEAGLIPESGRSLREENGNHYSILARKIPWTEEPGSSLGSKKTRLSNCTHTHTHTHNAFIIGMINQFFF